MKEKVAIVSHGGLLSIMERVAEKAQDIKIVNEFSEPQYAEFPITNPYSYPSYLVEGYNNPPIKNKSGIGCPYDKKGIHNYPQAMVHALMNQDDIDKAVEDSKKCSLCGYKKELINK